MSKEQKEQDLTTIYISGFYDGEKKWKDKIKDKIKEIETEKKQILTIQPSLQAYEYCIEVLENLLKEN